MKKILIVDDSSFILKDILTNTKDSKKVLTEDIEIMEANGKIEALNQMKKSIPDVILLDIVMIESETEGLELLKEIKNFFDSSKIIIISSIGQLTIRNECFKLGIERYLHKPFEHEQVIEAVNNALNETTVDRKS
jgi:two-component system chemotaxis response regulator CheY